MKNIFAAARDKIFGVAEVAEPPSMPRSITIEITAEDVRVGQEANATGCPVALALKRAVPDAPRLIVGVNRVYIYGDSDVPYVYTNSELPEYISRFDHNIAIEPRSFTLKLSGY